MCHPPTQALTVSHRLTNEVVSGRSDLPKYPKNTQSNNRVGSKYERNLNPAFGDSVQERHEHPLGDAQGKQAEVEEQQQGQRQHVAGLELEKLVSVRVRERQAALRIVLRESRVHHRRGVISSLN